MLEYRQAQILIAFVRGWAEGERRRASRRSRELGATALEWAVISAIVIGLAVFIGLKIKDIVQKHGDDLTNEDTYTGPT